MFNATLTLPGIAGFILTIGAAVDANVLINERIREEIRRGRRLIDAVETGYREAFRAIFDANVTHVISAVDHGLFRLRPGARFRRRPADRRRHFGVHRGLFHPHAGGAVDPPRPARANCTSEADAMKLLKLVPDHTNLDFMRWRNLALVLSTLRRSRRSPTPSIAGSTSASISSAARWCAPNSRSRSRSRTCAARVGRLGVGEASIQALGNDRTYQIRLPKPAGPETAANQRGVEIARRDSAAISRAPGSMPANRCRARSARNWPSDSAKAIIFAMLGIAIYIWFRFEWQFGVGALLTLAHDVAMTLGFFAFTQLQVDLNVVAAFLTIVGYSLNDTVVIYDRIRENLRKYRKMAILPLLNLSLNETLARTVVTSLTVLIALGVLMLIGPEVIFGLAIAIFLGVLIGTYSSIYISAPVLVWLGRHARQLPPGRREGRRMRREAQPA